MSVKREGDLRLLKDGVAFGPTDRQGLEKLLSAGRLTLSDHVSVANADWVPIAEYLAGGAAMRPAATATATPAVPRKQGDLRLLSGGRIIASLTRGDVDLLWSGGRLDAEDLICAVGGPWMRVGDFVAPPKAAEPSPTAATSQTVVAVPVAVATPMPAAPAIAYVVPPLPAPVARVPVPPPLPMPAYAPPLIDPLIVPPLGAAVPGHYPLAYIRPPSPTARDEWYVRVRGIHSAPLRKQHVKALYQAREVTLDCVARHPTWHENDWRPIHSIAELADITRP